MTKKQKDTATKLIALMYEWKKEEPDEFKSVAQKGDNASGFAGLIHWLLISNRIKGVKV